MIDQISVDDEITDGEDDGKVLKVTPTWVLIDSTERMEPRWVHESDLHGWWEVPTC